VPVPFLPFGSCVTLDESLIISELCLPQNDIDGLGLPEGFISEGVLGMNDALMNLSKSG
jgi:hypothetical protein